MMVQALQEANTGLSTYEQLAKDVCWFCGFFSKLQYSSAKRDDNMVTHNLTRMFINFLDYVVWMEEVPPLILHVFQADKALLV